MLGSGKDGGSDRGRGRSRGRGRGGGGDKCFNCNQFGHRKADCPQLRRDTPTSSHTPSQASPSRASGGGDQLKCFQCNQFGHRKADCPQLRRQTAVSSQPPSRPFTSRAGGDQLTCFNCNQTGHRKADCPQLGRQTAVSSHAQSRASSSRTSDSGARSHQLSQSFSELQIDLQPVTVRDEDIINKARPTFVKRPDYGIKGRLIEVISNHFRLTIKDIPVYQYRIDIKPSRSRAAATAAGGGDESTSAKVRKLKQKEVRDVFDHFVTNTPDLFGDEECYPVYDGDCIMITAKELPIGSQKYDKIVRLEGDYKSNYKINVQLAQVIDLSAINLYYDGIADEVPRHVIQAIELILKYGPSANRIPIGNSLYPKDSDTRHKDFIDRNCTKFVSYGHYQSLHLSQVGPTLIVDRSATAFYIGCSLKDFVDKFARSYDPRRLTGLKGLKVYTKNLPYKRTYTIKAVHNSTADNTFFDYEEDGKTMNISVKDYYKRKYKRDIDSSLPLIIPNGGKRTYLPMDLCVLFADQPVSRGALTGADTSQLVRKCGSQRPIDRFSEIYKAVTNIVLEGKNYLQEFVIDLEKRPLLIPARIIKEPSMFPEIKGRNRPFYSTIPLKYWIVINLCADSSNRYENFIEMMTDRVAPSIGFQISKPKCSDESATDRRGLIKKLYQWAIDQTKNRFNLQMIFFIIPEPNPYDDYIYNDIKLNGNIHHGIATQCVKSKNVVRPPSDIHYNILLKMNAKLGGINSILNLPDKPDILRNKVMIIGADVTHPAPGSKLVSSVAACVGSYDKDHCYYAASIHVQERSPKVMQASSSSSTGGDETTQTAQEMIKEFDIMIKELLTIYRNENKYLPDHIIYYRDGVSESQFSQVLKFEYEKLKEGCRAFKIAPKISIITVQKRHHTRFRPLKEEDGDRKGNVLPGTTVDKRITHPADFDFYLNSHNGIQGTNRPTHYYVLRNDHKFFADDLQKLTYYLCYTYARCEKPISIPSPVMYAHLAAFSARNHIVACNIHAENRSRNETEDERREREQKLARRLNNDIKVNASLKNRMYFC